MKLNHGTRKTDILEGLFHTFACPCLPVFEVDISTILHGRSLIMTNPFLRSDEHWAGKVSDAPESPPAKSPSSMLKGTGSLCLQVYSATIKYF